MAAVDALWGRYESPLFQAWLELAVAARTDAELRASLAPVEARLRVAIQNMARDLFGSDGEVGGRYGDLVQLTFHLMQGLAVERCVLTESRRARDRREAEALHAWKQILAEQVSARG
jgi:hypothetical protein